MECDQLKGFTWRKKFPDGKSNKEEKTGLHWYPAWIILRYTRIEDTSGTAPNPSV
jgi:hypothetical protein